MYPRMVHDGKKLVIPPAVPNGQDQVGLGLSTADIQGLCCTGLLLAKRSTGSVPGILSAFG